jgi:cytochrome c oxidase subunit II
MKILIPSVVVNMLFAQSGPSLSFPEQASTFASDVDSIYNAIMIISIFFFVLILVAMIWFVYKYRFRPGHEKPIPSTSHNTLLEITWTVLPTILLVWMFAAGASGYMDMRTPPTEAKEIQVSASQWAWSFNYPGEGESEDLHLLKNQPVKMRLVSKDVLHSFFIAEFRQKHDVVPGVVGWTWFTPTMASTAENPFRLRCTEYCGTGHSNMNRSVIVHEGISWEEMLERFVRYRYEEHNELENGERIYKINCIGCHSTDGTVKVGPSFKGHWKTEVEVMEGNQKLTVPVDENYLIKSINEPYSQVRVGFKPQMPEKFFGGRKLTQNELDYLIYFIRSLNNDAPNAGSSTTPDAKTGADASTSKAAPSN